MLLFVWANGLIGHICFGKGSSHEFAISSIDIILSDGVCVCVCPSYMHDVVCVMKPNLFFQGGREFVLRAHFGLPSVEAG